MYQEKIDSGVVRRTARDAKFNIASLPYFMQQELYENVIYQSAFDVNDDLTICITLYRRDGFKHGRYVPETKKEKRIYISYKYKSLIVKLKIK